MKYKELNNTDWLFYLNKINDKSLFIEHVYLEKLKISYNVKLIYVGIFKEDEIVLLCCLFIRANKVVIPTHYAYLYMWEKYYLTSSIKMHEVLNFFLYEIQKKYTSISFRLAPNISDIRPFLWNGFKCKLFYTYVKRLEENNIHHSLSKLIKKPLSDDYYFDINKDLDIVWKFHATDILSFGFRKKNVQSSIQYFKLLFEEKKAHTYNIYYKGTFLASIIALLDMDNKHAYFPLVGTMDKPHYQKNVSAHLYCFAINELKKLNIENIDFMGANTESIARYKSKFGGTLTPHYNVHYSKYDTFKKNIREKIISFLKKTIR